MDEATLPAPTDTPAPAAATLNWQARFLRRLVLLAGAAGFFALMNLAARWVGFPRNPGFEASLFQQSGTILSAVLLAAIGYFVCEILGNLLFSWIHFNAGLFVASCGLLALSCRGGTMVDILHYAADRSPQGNRVFLVLALESTFLFVIVGAGWLAIWKKQDVKEASDQPKAAGRRFDGVALVVQVLIIGLLMVLLAQSEAKSQVLGALAISSLLSAGVVEHYFPRSHMGRWFWLAPLLVSLIGYLYAHFKLMGLVADQQIETLWLGHFKSDPEHQDPFLILAALARPIPLDYVSVGAAFSLVGHWIGRPLFAAIDEVLFPSRSQNSRS